MQSNISIPVKPIEYISPQFFNNLIINVDPIGHSGIVTLLLLTETNPAAICATPLLKFTAGD